jgi:GNAT superfamily N-acetyltransferase
MNDITIATVTSKDPEYKAVLQLREDVLRKPLGMSLANEDLSMDAEDTIFIALHDGQVIGCLMLHSISDTVMKFRQMAVSEVWQGKGIGRLLMTAAEQQIAAKGYTTIMLHARQIVCGFYEALGYDITSSAFTEVGIPHVIMKKVLA